MRGRDGRGHQQILRQVFVPSCWAVMVSAKACTEGGSLRPSRMCLGRERGLPIPNTVTWPDLLSSVLRGRPIAPAAGRALVPDANRDFGTVAVSPGNAKLQHGELERRGFLD